MNKDIKRLLAEADLTTTALRSCSVEWNKSLSLYIEYELLPKQEWLDNAVKDIEKRLLSHTSKSKEPHIFFKEEWEHLQPINNEFYDLLVKAKA